MKFRNNILVQIATLLVVVLISYSAGSNLGPSNSSNLVRGALQFAISFGVLVAFGTTILAFRIEVDRRIRKLVVLTLMGAVIAGLSAVNLESASNYYQTLDILRISSILALLLSVITLSQLQIKK